MQNVLITGSSGLIGTALSALLESQGFNIKRFDINENGPSHGDVRHESQVRQAVKACDGIIHLAAVSRVIWGEQDPERCWETNVNGLRHVLSAAHESDQKPWIISASSREIYGQPETLPANEDCPPQPVNIYGRAKVKGEELVEAARRRGQRACTIRLSNVFGSVNDHEDRVVPAFARGAVLGQELRIDGADHTFDFTYVDDVVRGIALLVDKLVNGEQAPPPIHFVSGKPTTLGQLAELAIRLAHSSSTIRHAPPRDFDVARFYGCNARARHLLGWSPQVSLEEGLARLINAYAATT